MNVFKIEDARAEEAEEMRSIVRDFWLELYPNEKYGITKKDLEFIDWFNPEYLARRRKNIATNRNSHTWVIKNTEGKIIGFCVAFKTWRDRKIDAMYVLKEFQGRGLGKKLLNQALEWLGTRKDIKLHVVAYNTNAINFYKKFGFKETSTKVDYEGTQLPSGKEIPRIEMVKLYK